MKDAMEMKEGARDAMSRGAFISMHIWYGTVVWYTILLLLAI